MNEQDAYFERMDRTLDELVQCHRSIYDITSQIGQLVESGDGDGVAYKLTQREYGLQQLYTLHEELKALMLVEQAQRIESEAPGRFEHYRNMGKRLASWVEVTLSLDEENKRLLTRAKNDLSRKLGQIRDSRKQIQDRRYYELDRSRQGMSFLG